MEDHKEHLTLCEAWKMEWKVLNIEWVHSFFYILDMIIKSWYIQQETRHETVTWEKVL